MGQESDTKSQLVLEICSLSTCYIDCAHRHHFSRPPVNPHFVDWYRLLGVQEDVDIDVIRKRYRKLALQLHPDKNKHPKAEIAFKLVLEAYSCLSDIAKRKAFDLERWKNFCIECNRIPYITCTSKLKEWDPANGSRSGRILQGLKDIKARFKEEAIVMENCLKANAVSRKESPLFDPSSQLFQGKAHCRSPKESPIFDPSDYLYGGYPHIRTRVYKKPADNVWYSHRKNIFHHANGIGKQDSPIFEAKSGRGLFKSKSTFVHS